MKGAIMLRSIIESVISRLMIFLFIGLIGFYGGRVYSNVKQENILNECVRGYNKLYKCKMR